jgi:hypothetical protein
LVGEFAGLLGVGHVGDDAGAAALVELSFGDTGDDLDGFGFRTQRPSGM